jgi:glycosyltransferase involved in cell wall biosynthesis
MKGHPFLLKSIAPLLRAREDIILAVTGHGAEEYEQYLKQMTQELGIADKTVFLGWVSDMQEFYGASTIACIPSRAEPFGRTVIEAFASRLPVIATAVGGMKDIIRDEENGLLVQYGNSEDLLSAIKRILSDRDLRLSLIDTAFQDAKKNYHESSYQNKIYNIINNLN